MIVEGAAIIEKKKIGLFCTKSLDPPRGGRESILINLLDNFHQSTSYEIVLLSFCGQTDRLKQKYNVIELSKPFRMFEFILNVLRGYPLQVALYNGRHLRKELQSIVDDQQLDIIITDMLRTSVLATHVNIPARILDMDDLISRRYRQSLSINDHQRTFGKLPFKLPGFVHSIMRRIIKPILWYEGWRMELYERRLPKQFNSTVLVSYLEADMLRQQIGSDGVVTIPNYIEFDATINAKSGADGNGEINNTNGRTIECDLLFFGNLSIPHNVDSANYIINYLYPQIKARHPSCTLRIVGWDVHQDIVDWIKSDTSIELFQDVGDISKHILSSRISFCPQRFGSGVKTKILESLYLGTPVVTTPIGAEGIPDAEAAMYIGQTDDELIDAVLSLLDEPQQAQAKVLRGSKIVRNHFSRGSVITKWTSLIEDALTSSNQI